MQQQTQQGMKQGIEQYHQPKPEGDIDLIAEVRQHLVNSGLAQRATEAFDNNHFIAEAANKPSTVQRFLLNRYWGMQLMQAGKPSIEERYCLIPNGEVSDWLKLFKEKILPFVIENNLPVSIQ